MRGNGYVYGLGGDNGFMGVYLTQTQELYTLNRYSFLHINHICFLFSFLFLKNK